MQERIVDKWKNEHKATVEHYEKTLRAAKVEARQAKERVVELKGRIKMEKENNDENLMEKMRKASKSKSKERSSKGKKE